MISSMSLGQVAIEIHNTTWRVYYLASCLLKGDVFHDPLLMVPEVADRKNLAKFYEVVSD